MLEEDINTIKRFLVALGFEKIKTSETTEVWGNSTKSITFQISKNYKRHNYLEHSKNKFRELIIENFTSDEIKQSLKIFLNVNKVRFNKRDKTKILRINTNNKLDLEGSLLNSLLPEDYQRTIMDYTTPIEFTESLTKNIKNKFLKQLDEEIINKVDNTK